MANRSVFASLRGQQTNTRNAAGVPAYDLVPAHRLAQLAMTGTFGGGYYQDAQTQARILVELANTVSPDFLARIAIYARDKGHMKDTPALLLAVLSRRDPVLFAHVFSKVVTSGRMLRTFVQVMRSGQTGRKSLGSRPKAMVRNWLDSASDEQLLAASIGNAPSLADIIRMVHPRPGNLRREAFYAWLIGRPAAISALPPIMQDLLAFRSGLSDQVPAVPFQLLSSLPLSSVQWGAVARMASWQTLRQGLNMLTRNGAFNDPDVVTYVAAVLRDHERFRAAKALPYQLLATLKALDPEMPLVLREALHDAMERAVSNVPHFGGRVVICPDVSKSMCSPVTGYRGSATTAVKCIDVAALVAAAIKRGNPTARILPFAMRVHDIVLESRDTILTNARRLAELGGGGTDCMAPLSWLNVRHEAADLVVFVSDNASWGNAWPDGTPTGMMREWTKLKTRNPEARLVCIDIQPYGTTQAAEQEDILNIGGFSDATFDQIAEFASGRMEATHWVGQIMAQPL
ncbi:ribonucleoprotein [Komagataeibacter intermedius TF2]|uniref:RNA-binding protein n=3 Tax=Komagataeibacter intermedius TaxID=66229 RepID=A0A0N0MG98_9PROT|nr:RNA-binding protein [Komagataeibacter intermedius AF2]GAN88361.1 ribonucleoprotein [Komagataeibacter intermedius TF2]GBQ71703.1 TROVE domain-containing protein [Komagataeibacter intermedius NRIC 0521]